LQQHQAAEMSQRRIVEAKRQCSQAFWHGRWSEIASFGVPAQSSLKVNFVPERLKLSKRLRIQ
jgi:hypothetical protein